MKWTQLLGLGLLVVVGLVVGGLLAVQNFFPGASPVAPNVTATRGPAVTINGYIGSEKEGFLLNPEVQRLLKDRYNITVQFTKIGSLDMVKPETDLTGRDYLWPGNQVAFAIYRDRGGRFQRVENIFSSPLVFFSWSDVVDGLAKNGVARQRGDAWYLDLAAFIRNNTAGKTWSDYGVSGLSGRASVVSTDPSRSSSGGLFAALLASQYAGGDTVVSDASIERVIPQLTDYYRRLGYLERTSRDLFDQYLRIGKAGYPLIADYEAELIEFVEANKSQSEALRNRLRVVYPEPTMYTTHPLIALTPNGVRLADALLDKDIQRIAWESHGWRAGAAGVTDNPAVARSLGLAETIESSIPQPTPFVLNRIIQALTPAQ
jgi:hypothetical protein